MFKEQIKEDISKLTEIKEKRTKKSKTFDLGNKKRKTIISSKPIHYKDEKGNLKDIDVRLKLQQSNKGFKHYLASEHRFTTGFRNDKKVKKYYGIRRGRHQLETTPKKIIFDGQEIALDDVFEGINKLNDYEIEHIINSNTSMWTQVHEALVKNAVKTDQWITSFKIVEQLHLKGFKVVNEINSDNEYIPNENNAFVFVSASDPEDKIVFRQPRMWTDSSNSRNSMSKGIKHTLKLVKGKLIYIKQTTTKGEDWLATNEPTFYLDATATYNADSRDARIYRQYDDVGNKVYDGETKNGSAVYYYGDDKGWGEDRSLYGFDTSGLADYVTINSATLNIRGYSTNNTNVVCYEGTWSYPLSTSDWGSYNGNNHLGTYTAWSIGAWNSLNIGTSIVNKTGFTKILTLPSTNTNNSTRYSCGAYYSESAYAPYLTVDYTADNTAPTLGNVFVTGHKATNNGIYWTDLNGVINVAYEGHDETDISSGDSYLRATNSSGEDARINGASNGSAINNEWMTSPDIDLNGGGAPTLVTANTSELEVKYHPKLTTAGVTHTMQGYLRDNVNNAYGYFNLGVTLGCDGTAPSVSVDKTSRAWDNTNVSVTVSASDSESGLSKLEYAWSKNTSTPSNWNTINSGSTVTQSNSGQWYLHIRATDGVGNVRTTYHGVYKVDKTNPTVSYGKTSRAWDNTEVNVNLNFSDAHSGVATKQYAWSKSTATPSSWNDFISNPVKKSKNGEWYLHTRVVDNVGNVYTTYHGTYKIDDLKPSISFSKQNQDWTNQNISVDLTFTDSGGAGIANKYYKWSTGTATPTSWNSLSGSTVTLSTEGTFYLHAKGVDGAGNSTVTYRGPFKLDKTIPSKAGKPSSSDPTSDFTPTWNWSAGSDGLSGVAGYYIKIGTTAGGSDITPETWIGNVTSYTADTLPTKDDYFLSVKVEDQAGNQSAYVSSDPHPVGTPINADIKLPTYVDTIDCDETKVINLHKTVTTFADKIDYIGNTEVNYYYNIIKVSQGFKDKCRSITDMDKHNYSVYNVTLGKDITNYVEPKSVKVISEEKSQEGLTSTNRFNFTINLHRYSDNVALSDLINEGDIIEFTDEVNGEKITIFTGNCQPIKKSHENLNHKFAIRVYDKLFEGIKNKFDKTQVWTNYYISNNKDKANSLAHQFAYMMGFTDSEISFDDVFDDNGNPIQVKYAYLESNKKILSEFTELVKAFAGQLFVNNEGILKMKAPSKNRELTSWFEIDTNLNNVIDVNEIEAEYDSVKVKYDEFTVQDRQVVWQYIEPDTYNEEKDLANIVIDANTQSDWIKFEYVTPIVLNLEKTPETLFEDNQGRIVNLNYELDLQMNEGKVRFTNNNDFPVYIQRFKLYGEPLARFKDNEVTYTELTNPKKELEITNKYIQDETLATLNAQFNYSMKCRNRTKYTFESPMTSFIQLGNVINLNTLDVNDKAEVKRFTHSLNKGGITQFELLDHQPHVFENTSPENVKSRTPNMQELQTKEKINKAEKSSKSYADDTKPPKKEPDDILFHFDRSLNSTDGVKPDNTDHNATLVDGYFNKAVSIGNHLDYNTGFVNDWTVCFQRKQPNAVASYTTNAEFQNGQLNNVTTNSGSVELVTDSNGNYLSSGYIDFPELPLSAIKEVTSSLISWTETVPTNTQVKVEVSLDGKYSWTEVTTNGGSIPSINAGDNLQGKKLFVRVTLSTSDNTVTPSLDSINYNVKTDTYTFYAIKSNGDKFINGVADNMTDTSFVTMSSGLLSITGQETIDELYISTSIIDDQTLQSWLNSNTPFVDNEPVISASNIIIDDQGLTAGDISIDDGLKGEDGTTLMYWLKQFLSLYDNRGIEHRFEHDTAGNGESGVVLRVQSNPVAGEPIFVVKSSGQAQRLRVEHDGVLATQNPDMKVGIGSDGTGGNKVVHEGNFAVMTGTLNHGDTLPLPSGYSESQCDWLVSFHELNYNNTQFDIYENGIQDHLGGRCYINSSRQLVCYIHWNAIDHGGWTKLYSSADYIVIGRK